MRDQIMSQYLKSLASDASPGGGATAALHVAQAASLVGRAGADPREAEALSMYALRLAEKEAHAAARRVCGPAAEVITAAASVLDLAEAVRPDSRVATDLAAAAEAARAAATTARVSLEVHSAGPEARETVDALCDRADRLTAAIREAVQPA